MDYINELDELLDKIKKSHFETVHKLSGLYKKAEKLINEIKEEGEENAEKGMKKLKQILAESVAAKDNQVSNMSNYFQALFKTVLNNFAGADSKEQGVSNNQGAESFFNFPEVGSFEGLFGLKLEKEDTDKLYEIASNSIGAFYGLFKRVGEIISDDGENYADT